MSTKEQLVLPFRTGFSSDKAFPARPDIPFPPIVEGEAGVRGDHNASANERNDKGGAGGVRERGGDSPAAKAQPIPQNRRELALAIFAQCNPVALGRALLENGEDRGASVRLRGLEMFTEWAYGKGEPEEAPKPTRLIWDLPRRGERRDGTGSTDPESAEGGEK